MFRNILFAITLILLGVSFYYNQNFQLIAAGVAILLFGMSFLERGFESAASGTLYNLVKRLNNNFFYSFLLGIITTGILQSSSLITVIAISFLSTGLLNLRSGLAIVFGANLGTTSTAWVVAFLGLKLSISALALPMIFFGILLQSRKVALQKAIGNILLGLGGFFMGVYLMQLGFTGMEGALFFHSTSSNYFVITLLSLASGILLTAVLQSSSATMAIIITALVAGKIDFNQSLVMAIGANIGTTVTAILSSLNARLPGKQLAIGHVIFNVMTGIIALALLPVFSIVIDKSVGFLDIDHSDQSLRLALFHSLFNLLGVIVIMPFTKPLVRFLKRIKLKRSNGVRPKYLSSKIERIPQAAYLALHKEAHHVLHVLSDKMIKAIDKLNVHYRLGFFRMLTTSDSPSFKTQFHSDIKPILAEIQRITAYLAGTYKTEHFSVFSRLIAEISSDFDHILKLVEDKDSMDQKAFEIIYFELLHQLQISAKVLFQGLEENDDEHIEELMDSRGVSFDLFNKSLTDRINDLIKNKELSPLSGTTAIQSAHYAKRIIHKLQRATHLLYTVNYLELEAEQAFEQ